MSIPTVFADFLSSTDSSYLNTPGKMAEAISYRSSAWRRLLSGKSERHYLQGGKSIKSFIQLDDQNSAHFYGIGDEESPSQPQTVSAWEASWRFMRASYTYDDETVKLNVAGLGRTARHKVYFQFKQQLEQAMWIDQFKLMERQLWATPNESEMEGTTTGKQPYSLICFNNEETSGIPNSYSGTSVQGIDRSAKAQWRPQSLGYDEDTTATSVLQSMSRMFRQLGYDGLPDKAEYSSKSTMPAVVWTQLDGVMMYENSMRGAQDTFVYTGRQDPAYPNPTIHGVPVEYASLLDTQSIYPTGAAGVYAAYDSQASSNFAGPRFHFSNLDDMCPVFHSEMYMEKHAPQNPYRQPSRHTVYVDTYYNVVLHNSRTQGTVYPITADQADYISPPSTT